MNIVETSTQEIINQTNTSKTNFIESKKMSADNLVSLNELTFNLGLWLSGLESFLNLRSSTMAEENPTVSNWSKEFSLTHSVLLLCSKLTLELAKTINKDINANSNEDVVEILNSLETGKNELNISFDEIQELAHALKGSVLLSEGLLRAAPLNFNEWRAWSNSLVDRLKGVEAVDKLIKFAEKEGENFLPQTLQDLIDESEISAELFADLKMVLPRFAKILKWLSVVGRMLENDEPLKTALLLFAQINKQMQEMMSYINNRVLRFNNEENTLFSALDGAAYTASIELRKVYNQELKGLTEIRPTPLIYAKIETAYSLLNDSLQLTLVNFAQLIDHTIEPTDLFPNLQTKEEQSLLLRENMWNVLQYAKETEQNPEENLIKELNNKLIKFRDENLYFLFYKDMETVDRFIEEILITKDNKDLVPILHRFGAYIETLLGQINMRVVLANHPFEPMQKESHKMFV